MGAFVSVSKQLKTYIDVIEIPFKTFIQCDIHLDFIWKYGKKIIIIE